MELEDWELLSHTNISNSVLEHEQADQHDDVQVKEIIEVTEERDVAPASELQMEVELKESPELDVSVEFEEEVEGSDEKDCADNGFNHRTQSWRLRGIGIAAATLSMLLLGGCKRGHIQIYADDKEMNKVVQNPAKLSHVLPAMRGAPATTADVSFGGYWQGL